MPSTDLEQALLELVNATRLDPLGDAARYISSYTPLTSPDPDIQSALNFFQVSGSLLLQQYGALTPARPLAWNEQLAVAARLHNAAMIAADEQSHQVAGEPSLGTRLTNQGYNFTAAAENVYAYSESPLYAHAGFMVDWGYGTGGMQTPPGHRNAIMNNTYRELGIGITLEANGATSVGPQVVTQDFGSRGNTGVFVLGVAFADANDDGFYTVGEGTTGLGVAVGAGSTASTSSGGYTLSTAATGAQTIVLTGGGLSGAVSVGATFANGLNAKLDVVDGQELRTSISASVTGPVTVLQGLGLTGLALTTGAGAQTIIGTKGHDTLSGNAGNDVLRGGDGNDVVVAGEDNDSVYGGSGNDLIVGEDGNDSVEGEAGNDSIDGRSGDDTLLGGAEVDIVFGDAGADRVYGGDGSDVLMGERGGVSTTGGNDTLCGDADALVLSGGNDTIDGDAGDDVIYGGGGGDIILGDNGNDTIEGGAGADIIGGSAASVASIET
ncbi:MAG: CAP domain-containing protein, partial [Betaproteobacteria bacterium]|nr:CAP domain-containing protein [Betaproteobacteria bacterium]